MPEPFAKYLDKPVFSILSEVVEETGNPAFVVGGYVRDAILDRASKDVDVVVGGSGIELARKFAERIGRPGVVKVFRNFGTAMVRYQQEGEWVIEFVGARRESYRASSRKPIVEDGTLEDDQKRRDFTINTLALNLGKSDFGKLTDPFGGLKDLAEGIIRTPLDPDKTYSDDPLRMMRAIRFATQLRFTIEKESLQAIERNSGRISIISMERIQDELDKIMRSAEPSVGFQLLMKTGLLERFFPEMVALKGATFIEGRGHKDNFDHTLKVLDNIAELSDNVWLRWAAVLHDIGKPSTKKFDPEAGWTFHSHEFVGAKMVPSIFRKLKMPLDDRMRYVRKLVQLHLRPIVLAQDVVTDSAIRRLLFEAGDDIDDLMLLCEADITSKNPQKVRRYLDNFELVRRKLVEVEEKDRIRNWQPPVSGEVIMETFGIGPGKEVGLIKNAIREAILEGEIPNEFEEAYRFMMEEGKKKGLKPKDK